MGSDQTAPPRTQRRRAVIVHRRTELDALMDRHVTRGQVEFFLASRGRTLADVQARHDRVTQTRRAVVAGVGDDWVVGQVERSDLASYLFAPEDTIVVVGSDGLVANVAKYLAGQLVIGIDPSPEENPGVLVRHGVTAGLSLLRDPSRANVAELTMVAATTDDGARLTALNEIYVGHETHQSARYVLRVPEGEERQSSSGVIVGSGAGATGWCASLAHDRGLAGLPALTETALAWFVREAWPSPLTGVSLTSGRLDPGATIGLRVESDELVVFGDGIESDRLRVSWGQVVTVAPSAVPLRLAL
ncbi:MAG: hypothetical protein FWC46_08780 [Actinomycetia bacterium]|nr:hypothetical protein [Actinomycetes bacterium]